MAEQVNDDRLFDDDFSFSVDDLKDIPGFDNEEEKPTEDKKEKSVKEEKKGKEENKKEPSEKSEESLLEDEVRSKMDEEFGKPEKTSKNKNKDVGGNDFTAVKMINSLREQNIIDFDDPEDGENPYNDEEAIEILRLGIEDRIELGIEDKMKGLSPLMKNLLKYELDGGDPMVIIDQLNKKSTSAITENIDLNDEASQKLIVRETLKEEGYDDEYIKMQIEFLEDSGKLKVFSKKKYEKWLENNKAVYEKELLKQKEERERREEELRKYRNKLNDFINDSDSIGDLQLNSKDKKVLTSYMLDRVVKTKNSSNITNFHADLGEVLQNQSASVQLAKLLRSRDKNGLFTFDNIKKEVETKTVNSIRDNLRRNDKTVPSSRNGGEKKTLADYFS